MSMLLGQLTPIYNGAHLIQDESLTRRAGKWMLLAMTQVHALVPIIAGVIMAYMMLVGRSLSTLEFWVLMASCLELEFYLYCVVLHKRLQVRRSMAPRTPEERRILTQQLLAHPEGLASMITRWFLPLGKKLLSRSRLDTFFAWCMFDCRIEEMGAEDRAELDQLVEIALQRVPGIVGSQEVDTEGFMTMNFDPMVVQHKPLMVYMAIWTLQAAGYAMLLAMGFKRLHCKGMNYWLYQPKTTSNEAPAFFIHGIGIGLVMYCNMVRQLVVKKPNRPVILLELPNVGVSLSGAVPSMDQTLCAVDSILKSHSFSQCTFVGHSYGTLIAAWIAKHRPNLVARLVLIDPVCFLVWEPSLIYNFLYSKPMSFTQFMCQFYVSNDMYVSHTLRRHFWWFENNLFPEFLTTFKTKVFLAERDYIIDAPFINDYLKRATDPAYVDVTQFPNISHGNYLNSQKHMDTIISHV
ncbi:hypothetical protein DSO57_1012864 [Entomophthora muscae]|uniref:Uncharacterized protein n=1 Tax=Entomophthora muscae TaxID=34485 RepID=A0ACC2TTL9_9FUNG|nr:hypothetical protein DSO57_1012864 [Entomophthora muscae]